MSIVFLSPAEHELREAMEYYENIKPGLGEEFFEATWSAIERINQHPKAWQKLSQNTRRCQLHRFPYGVIYQIREDENQILVIAIGHLHRKPDYWRKRI